MSAAVVNTIAGEAQNNKQSIDAVINNMLNRVGTKGYGRSGNLREVARAPGQYAGYRVAAAKQAEFILSRIKAVASGGEPDITGGSNEYRASWYSGPWGRKHANSPVIGGNRFAYNPAVAPGPYAPYASPKEGQATSSPPQSATADGGWTGGKPSGLYGSPEVQALLQKYGMGKQMGGRHLLPLTQALTESGGWAAKASAIVAALKLDTRLAVHGLTQDWRDITAYGHNLKEAIKKGLGGPAAREKDRLKNQLLSSHAAAKAFDMRASAADHLKSAPLGSGHQHLMNHSNVHAPSQHNNITIHGVTDPETAMRDLGWHQKRLWSGLTRNTTTTAN